MKLVFREITETVRAIVARDKILDVSSRANTSSNFADANSVNEKKVFPTLFPLIVRLPVVIFFLINTCQSFAIEE